jgi:hypothetical protein
MKGQVKQVFVYIMTLIIIGFIILIALRSFGRLDETRCNAELVLFQRELGEALANNLVWGREETVSLTKPCDYEVLCVVDARLIEANRAATTPTELGRFTNLGVGASLVTQTDLEVTNILKDSVESGIEKNLFLIKRKDVIPFGYDAHIHLELAGNLGNTICPDAAVDCPGTSIGTETIPSYAFCIPSRAGQFSFTLLGAGRRVMVRPK